MERRLDERYQTDLDVTVTNVDAPDRITTGRIFDISKSGVRADLPMRFAPGTSIKAQVGTNTLFGHVVYCDDYENFFRTGIEVAHVLVGESDLAKLVRAVQAASPVKTEKVKTE
ncbi:MAG TPA: PilZ domain-containing protein [Bryobacteraceae bacterium]|nr:PilZ domain-containing protein [Bryobacteraceae bacterium]